MARAGPPFYSTADIDHVATTSSIRPAGFVPDSKMQFPLGEKDTEGSFRREIRTGGNLP